jgi:hypothetical protein
MRPAEMLNEAQWQELVVQFATLHGWATMHQLHSRGTEAGWPDLVLIRPPELLIVELKSERGKVSAAQQRWLADLAACGVETALWRPSDEAEVFARLGRTQRPLRAVEEA